MDIGNELLLRKKREVYHKRKEFNIMCNITLKVRDTHQSLAINDINISDNNLGNL